MLLRVTGKDVKDLHQIKTHQFLSRELIYRLQQGRLYSCDFEKKNRYSYSGIPDSDSDFKEVLLTAVLID